MAFMRSFKSWTSFDMGTELLWTPNLIIWLWSNMIVIESNGSIRALHTNSNFLNLIWDIEWNLQVKRRAWYQFELLKSISVTLCTLSIPLTFLKIMTTTTILTFQMNLTLLTINMRLRLGFKNLRMKKWRHLICTIFRLKNWSMQNWLKESLLSKGMSIHFSIKLHECMYRYDLRFLISSIFMWIWNLCLNLNFMKIWARFDLLLSILSPCKKYNIEELQFINWGIKTLIFKLARKQEKNSCQT